MTDEDRNTGELIAGAFTNLEKIKTGDWPDWMETKDYPCDACQKPLTGFTYRKMWEKDWEIRVGKPNMSFVMFYCDDCGERNSALGIVPDYER